MGSQFIGLGFQKCATTWLSMRLMKHPEIWTPPIRELHFWDSYERAKKKMPEQYWYVKGIIKKFKDEHPDKDKVNILIDRLCYWNRYQEVEPNDPSKYLDLFSPNNIHKAYGEISPSYVGLTEETLKLIKKTCNNPKVFIIMREPIARIWSQIQHEKRLHPEKIYNTNTMLDYLDSENMKAQANYDKVIERLKFVFPEENLRFFFFEDMIEDPEAYLNSFCDFIGVPYNSSMMIGAKKKKKKKKTSLTIEKMPLVVQNKVENLYGHVSHNVEKLIGRVPHKWK